MKVSETGEFGLISLLSRIVEEKQNPCIPALKNLKAGIGDDAAAWENSSSLTLITTDCMVQDIHFTLERLEWESLGWKALAVNLSDIAAMGGSAEFAVVTLGLPGDTLVEDITDLYTGMIELGNRCGVAITGGDVTRADIVFINIAVTGASREHLLRRSAAAKGDLIAVTGYPGAAAAGLRLISSKIPAGSEDEYLRQAFLRPLPRLEAGKIILEAGGRCAIDISDGLFADLKHICQASGTGANIHAEKIPLHPAARRFYPAEALDMALGGGEDYELLFTADKDMLEAIRNAVNLPVTIIGEITSDELGTVRVLCSGGGTYRSNNTGWDHFRHAGI